MIRHWMRVCLLGCLSLSLKASGEETHLKFPKEFKLGVASCEYQNSGADICPDSQWAEWERGEGNIVTGEMSGESTRHYFNQERTIRQIKELGCNTYRFSIEWSKVEPEAGVYDEEVIEHYSEFVDMLLENGIEPMITLHHFSNPQWFQDLGQFEDPKNNHHLVRFSKKMFNRLSDRVKLWCTINEPGVYAMQGYFMKAFSAAFPPGKSVMGWEAMKPMTNVVKNMLMAHASIYDTLKKQPNGKECKIGLVHQFLEFQGTNCVTNKLASMFSYGYHRGIFECLKTGDFKFGARFGISPDVIQIHKAKDMMDFIGINYYSTPLLGFKLGTEVISSQCREEKGEFMMDMPYRFYPKGLKKAIRECHELLDVPIFITENGACDRDDQHRKQWIHDHLQVVSEAIDEGFDVQGFYYWTLNDNWEWAEGYKEKFGLYEYDFENQKATLRDGSKEYIEIIDAHKKRWNLK